MITGDNYIDYILSPCFYVTRSIELFLIRKLGRDLVPTRGESRIELERRTFTVIKGNLEPLNPNQMLYRLLAVRSLTFNLSSNSLLTTKHGFRDSR